MDELLDLVAGVLKIDRSGITTETGPLNQSQWDSFHHVHIVTEVEEKYGIEMTPEEITALLSVGDIASLLRSKGAESF